MTSETQVGERPVEAVEKELGENVPPTSKQTELISNPGLPNQSANPSSPTKRNLNENSPSKLRSKRKHDAKRRSANHGKKQASNNNDQSEKTQQPSKTLNNSSPHNQSNVQKQQIVNSIEADVRPTTENSVGSHGAQSPPDVSESNNLKNDTPNTSNSRGKQSVDLNKDRSRECRQLREQLKSHNVQIQALVERVGQQATKIKELDTALLSTSRTCNQLERLLQQELTARARLETENASLNQTVSRLKVQLSAHEKNKTNNDELVRVLNATLMERETEVSILKLKLTRMQTNPSSTMGLCSTSNVSLLKTDPAQVYATTGRSNSEFDRNSYIRSSLIAEAASAKASYSQSRGSIERDSVWANVPEELTPSKRPQILERSLYEDPHYGQYDTHSSTPLARDRRYKTLPRSMKSPSQEFRDSKNDQSHVLSVESKGDLDTISIPRQPTHCQVTNLDDSNSTSQGSGNRTIDSSTGNEETRQIVSSTDTNPLFRQTNINPTEKVNYGLPQRNSLAFVHDSTEVTKTNKGSPSPAEPSHYSTISKGNLTSESELDKNSVPVKAKENFAPSLPSRAPTTPVKLSSGLKKIFDKLRRSDSSSQSKTDLTSSPITTPAASPFKRGGNRSTLAASGPNEIRAQLTPRRQVMNFQTDKPFCEWDTDMLVDWLTVIGLSMYTNQCRRWVKCGAHIMNATPAEVDKGLGITNHLHRKKLRLAISELNGDCDKITKAAAKLDYLWVARWLDDIGLPQYKESFINARIDGRVLNYLTVDDLVSMGVKSYLHHASIRCGIRVLRSINFDLQLLKRRATAEELERMSSMRQQMSEVADNPNNLAFKQDLEADIDLSDSDVPLWTCHRVMEWLRLIDFAEFAPNLRGSGVHGGLIVYEDGFNIDTMCSILSIPIDRTLLRRHLSTFFKELIGKDLAQRKRQHQDLPSNQQLNPMAEIRTPKKTSLWFTKVKSSRVGQDETDEYLCPMYPVEPQVNKSKIRKNSSGIREEPQLSRIPESINV